MFSSAKYEGEMQEQKGIKEDESKCLIWMEERRLRCFRVDALFGVKGGEWLEKVVEGGAGSCGVWVVGCG